MAAVRLREDTCASKGNATTSTNRRQDQVS